MNWTIRKTSSGIAIFATLVLLSGVATAADPVAYMATGSGNFGTIDLSTGVFSDLGNSGQTLAGLGVTNGTLYGSSFYGGIGSLFSINKANGALTLIGSSTLNYDDFGSTTRGIYAVDGNADLYSINPTTGAASLIGSTGLSFGSWRNLSTNSSTLYFADGSKLYTLNTNSGAATLVGSTGGQEMGGLVTEGGVLYGGQDTSGIAVDTLNTVTGAATTGSALSGTGSGQIYGLAPIVPVPEPDTYAMMLAGLGLIGFMVRRKKTA
jgi:hypothetical protein